MSIDQFWDSTLDEIKLYIKAYNDKLKEDISLAYMESKNTALFVGCVLAGKQIPSLLDLYPGLYQNEIQAATERQTIEWQKEMLKVFADERNHYLEVKNNGT